MLTFPSTHICDAEVNNLLIVLYLVLYSGSEVNSLLIVLYLVLYSDAEVNKLLIVCTCTVSYREADISCSFGLRVVSFFLACNANTKCEANEGQCNLKSCNFSNRPKDSKFDYSIATLNLSCLWMVSRATPHYLGKELSGKPMNAGVERKLVWVIISPKILHCALNSHLHFTTCFASHILGKGASAGILLIKCYKRRHGHGLNKSLHDEHVSALIHYG